MDLQQRINAFAKLGEFLGNFSKMNTEKNSADHNNTPLIEALNHQIKLAEEHNGWFTKQNILFALQSWSNALTFQHIDKWLEPYNINIKDPKTVAVIMAGNIPLVGFHDFISVLVTGHKVLIKQSSNDKHLLPFLAEYLKKIEPGFKDRITFSQDKLENFDAVIATGSNNTARYFEYYFKNKPSLIRKNRNSIAILTGNETEAQLKALSEDIFRYYGLGCRNVSKLFLPNNYNFDAFFNAMYHWHPIINQAKYANNYDYNKAVYLMSEFEMLENGFLMLKEDKSYSSPIATVFYEHYDTLQNLKEKINSEEDNIQCIVSDGVVDNEIKFGHTQSPQLWDYADGVDTVEFLLKT